MTASSGRSPLFYRELGQGAPGLPVLCLHGHPGSGRNMAVFTRPLSRYCRTIAPDLRGYGRSPAGGEFTMDDQVAALEALLDHLAIDRCWILGWSLGGMLALELALRDLARVQPRIAGLALVATAARPWGNHPPVTWREEVLTGLAALLNTLFPGWQWNIDTLGRRSLLRYLMATQTPAAYRYLAESAVLDVLQTSGAARRALGRAIAAGYDRLADCESLSLPCLVLAGGADRHICAAASQATAAALPRATWRCYDGLAHLFPWENPEGVLADLEAWLKSEIFNLDSI